MGMFSLPGLNDGKYHHYEFWFSIIVPYLLLYVVGISLFFIVVLTCVVRPLTKAKRQHSYSVMSDSKDWGLTDYFNETSNDIGEDDGGKVDCLQRTVHVLSWLIAYSCSVSLLWMASWYSFSSIFVLNMIIGSAFASLPPLLCFIYTSDVFGIFRKSQNKGFAFKSFGRKCCMYLQQLRCGPHRNLLLLFASINFILNLIILFFSSGLCICFFAPMEGGLTMLDGTITVSSWFSRSLMNHDCTNANGEPCHVYLTLPYDTSKGVIINVQTPVRTKALAIEFWDTKTPEKKYQRLSKSIAYSNRVESNGQRLIHSAYVPTDTFHEMSLVAFSIKFCAATDKENCEINQNVTTIAKTWKDSGPVRYFRSFPSSSSNNFDFVFGGDVGSTPIVQNVSSAAGAQNPLFAVVGGDIAYDNAMPSCYGAWDAYLSIMENDLVGHANITLASGKKEVVDVMVPLIVVVGNHDVGSDALSGAPLDEVNPPPYYYHFPQHLISLNVTYDTVTGKKLPNINEVTVFNGSYTIPDISQRIYTPWHSHIVGSSTLFIGLDSGHQVKFSDETQLKWLTSTLAEHSDRPFRFASYHVPLYPSTPHASSWEAENKKSATRIGREAWTPLFDKYNLTAAFENHVHSLKATRPLTKGNVTYASGTVYFGDGCWGITPEDIPSDHRMSFESDRLEFLSGVDGTPHHVFSATMSDEQFTAQALISNGSKIETLFTVGRDGQWILKK